MYAFLTKCADKHRLTALHPVEKVYPPRYNFMTEAYQYQDTPMLDNMSTPLEPDIPLHSTAEIHDWIDSM
jgi:hypothetical protein